MVNRFIVAKKKAPPPSRKRKAAEVPAPRQAKAARNEVVYDDDEEEEDSPPPRASVRELGHDSGIGSDVSSSYGLALCACSLLFTTHIGSRSGV